MHSWITTTKAICHEVIISDRVRKVTFYQSTSNKKRCSGIWWVEHGK